MGPNGVGRRVVERHLKAFLIGGNQNKLATLIGCLSSRDVILLLKFI